MQNERLFKKIKQTALIETSGIEEYNPDKLWADIEKRQSKKGIWLWWAYAAASILLFIGLSFWLHKLLQADHPVMTKRSRIESQPAELSKNKSVFKRSQPGNISAAVSGNNHPSSKSIKLNAEKSSLRAQDEDLEASKTGFVDSLSFEGNIFLLTNATDSETNIQQGIKPKIEKVLIADISIPEEKTKEYSALRQIFDQVRKERQDRKMRLHFQRQVNKPGLWSFVHNSFIQYPPVLYPSLTKEKADIPH